MDEGANDTTVKRRRGRRATFDRTTAIAVARDLFWRHGYDGVGIADLTQAIGIAAPSLYHAFGSKAGLYREALRLYASAGVSTDQIERAPTSAAAARSLLEAGTLTALGSSAPAGCMVSSGMLATSRENAGLADELTRLRAELRLSLEKRIARDIAEGVLPSDADAPAMARFIIAVLQGMSVQAIDGADRADLQSVADTAVSRWPTSRG